MVAMRRLRVSSSGENDHEEEGEDDDELGDEEDPKSYSLEDIKTKVMILDPKIANDMWFI